MAQVNVDLSEYDMLREAKTKAESQVKELTEEVKKLKDNAANVVVRNRYYLPSIDYKRSATNIIRDLGCERLIPLVSAAQEYRRQRLLYPDTFHPIKTDLIKQVAYILEENVKNLLNLRSGYIEDATITEIRGFDEFAESIKAKLELEYRQSFEEKKAALDKEKEQYDIKHLDVEKAVEQAENTLKDAYTEELKVKDKDIEALREMVSKLKEQLKEASKSSEEKLADAMAKLKEAQAEVAKYQNPKRKWFKLFK